MKKLFLSLFAVCCAFTACSDGEGNDPKEIVLDEGTQTSQTIYADETANKGEGIKFTTTGPWTAEVTEVTTRAAGSNVEWLKLNQYSGDKAGDYTLTLTLTENLTGADRKATIKIICGSTTITITVEQKGKKEDGSEPDVDPTPTLKQLISKITYKRSDDTTIDRSEITFTYDSENRVIGGEEIQYRKNGTTEDEGKATWTYTDNTITQYQKSEDGSYSSEDKIVYTLDATGKVVSWTSESKEIQNGTTRLDLIENGTHHYDADNYLQSVDIKSKDLQGDTWLESASQDICKWENGNLVFVKNGSGGDGDRYTATMEYGNVPNNANLDLNFCLTQSEWLDCLAFGEPGIKLFGYLGTRSAHLMTKETDHYENYYYTYKYELDDAGNVGKVTVKGYTDKGEDYNNIVYTITYIDAQ